MINKYLNLKETTPCFWKWAATPLLPNITPNTDTGMLKISHNLNQQISRCCGNVNAVVSNYGLMVCRRCFRDNAAKIGFVKYH
ncbi:Ribosomal_protein S29 [Hexamita inflata]|uniref:Ribosomal protein S29 n=2 Tax=Hexamita inflata TaxID=28002 RepID=A0AA86QSM9_9EUKA|nr:Ribosomal protein S29 [Hexamita inflata]CAI9963885.1 Ribosomal protein S29 [Hexamita inflata]